MSSILGVEFDECYSEREIAQWDDVPVSIISLERLKEAKRASGRLQDLVDLSHLEDE